MSYIQKRGKNTAWEKQMLKNLVADTILYGKIKTSLPVAKKLTKLLAKLITISKKALMEKEQKQHFYRLALRYLVCKKSQGVIEKLFDLGEKYQKRPGGYSRIIKMGMRKGDNNLRVEFSLV